MGRGAQSSRTAHPANPYSRRRCSGWLALAVSDPGHDGAAEQQTSDHIDRSYWADPSENRGVRPPRRLRRRLPGASSSRQCTQGGEPWNETGHDDGSRSWCSLQRQSDLRSRVVARRRHRRLCRALPATSRHQRSIRREPGNSHTTTSAAPRPMVRARWSST